MKPQTFNATAYAAALAALNPDLIEVREGELVEIEAAPAPEAKLESVKRMSCAAVIDEMIELDIDIASDSPDL